MSDTWSSHVKSEATKRGIKYGEAMTHPDVKASWAKKKAKAKNPPADETKKKSPPSSPKSPPKSQEVSDSVKVNYTDFIRQRATDLGINFSACQQRDDIKAEWKDIKKAQAQKKTNVSPELERGPVQVVTRKRTNKPKLKRVDTPPAPPPGLAKYDRDSDDSDVDSDEEQELPAKMPKHTIKFRMAVDKFAEEEES
jgi:hypothetical protein